MRRFTARVETQGIASLPAFRLPTEAEWEYACRAGTDTIWHFGNDETQLVDYAWYDQNSDSRTHPIGQLKPNAWGLYDMHGNVWEWCADPWHENYQGAPADGRAWEKDGNNDKRLLRGGSWRYVARGARCGDRDGGRADGRSSNGGVRVVVPVAGVMTR